MATVNYTTLLGMALPTTGDLSGTWGNEVNSYLTQYVDSAVAGTQTISADTNTTLTVTNGSALGSTSAQYLILNCTGARTAARTVTLPASSRHYVVINSTTGGFAVNIVGAGPTTGISVANGERCVIAWDGSDYVKIATSVADGVTTFSAGTTGFTPSSATSGAVTLAGTLATTNGGTGLTSFTSGGAVYATSTSALTTGTLPTTAGGTGLTSFTANGLVYASSSSALTTGSALTFDGTNFATTGRVTANDFVASGSAYYTFVGGTTYGSLIATAGTLTLNANNGTGLIFSVASSEGMRLTSTGLGIGTNSPVGKLDVSGSNAGSVLTSRILNTSTSASSDAQNFIYVNGATAGDAYTTWTVGGVTSWSGGVRNSDSDNWYLSPGSSLATSPTLVATTSGDVGIGTNSPSSSLVVQRASAVSSFGIRHTASGNGYGYRFATSGTTTNDLTISSEFNGSLTTRATITAAGFTQPVAYADTVSALGNTGTATTINLQNANVFTATLTGNCTFTLSNAIATGSSSFTLILTNDGTAGRTVAWAGGSFRFPGGAASLSRTTTANAIDIWVFFTPDGGTTWYGNIAMKNMTA